jgi:hypothetical protein
VGRFVFWLGTLGAKKVGQDEKAPLPGIVRTLSVDEKTFDVIR